jgi:hypothetical protein
VKPLVCVKRWEVLAGVNGDGYLRAIVEARLEVVHV